MRFQISDKDAIRSLINYGINHRAAIADWCLKAFLAARKQADKRSLAVEVYVNFMMAVEDLEMLYFALREKKRDPDRSFLDIYSSTRIKEHRRRSVPSPTMRSARNILRELRGMSIKGLQRELGLATFEDIPARLNASVSGTKSQLRREYNREVRGLIRAVQQTVRNRKIRMVLAANKVKHGFVVLDHPQLGKAFIVCSVRSRGKGESVVEAIPYEPKLDTVRILVENTKRVSVIMRSMLQLCHP